MRPHVFFLLALAALSARAASIPAPATINIEKKLAEAVKEVLDKDTEPNVSSEQELIDQANVVKDIDNKLLKQVAVDSIPVKVVVEEVKPALKAGEEKKDCDKVSEVDEDSEANIKRVEIDLKNPGEPEHQEHNTQNPEHFENEHSAVAKIKQMIQDTQVVFNSGFKDISDGLNNWLHDHETEVSVKESIEHLQETFMEQINKLNSTIQTYWNPEAVEDPNKQASIKKVESGLKVLEDNFESGVETLSHGVRVLSVLKSETRDDATTAAPAASNPLFPFIQNIQNIQTSVMHGFGNLSNTVQNFFANQGNNTASEAAAGAQSDEAATPRPPFWQGIQTSIQNIIRPGQSQQQGAQSDTPAQSSGPFAQVIQSNPFVQSVINFIQPKPQQAAAQPAVQKPSEPASDTGSEGSNAIPETADKPAVGQKQKPETEAQPAQSQAGPIQQMIQKNPIVQGIAGAVQKIQHSITNPEKPREETVQGEKAGYYPWHGGHGHRPGDEHNNDVDGSGVVKSAPVPEVTEVEKITEVEKKQEEPEKEVKPAETPVKQD